MTRRTVRYPDFDAALADCERLLASGYHRMGKWSLGQMCIHLATIIEMSMDGFPASMRLPWPARLFLRWFILGRIIRHKVIHRSVQAPKGLLPPDSVEDAVGLARFRAAIERFEQHTGPLHPSPAFGELTREQWREVNLWHIEHHLSFLM